MEQQRQEILANITSLVEEADRLKKIGLSKEEDNYELKLIDAFNTYQKAEQISESNVGLNYPVDRIEKKKEEVIAALDSAKHELATQSSQLSEIGEEEMARSYSERVKKVEDFINKNKVQNESK